MPDIQNCATLWDPRYTYCDPAFVSGTPGAFDSSGWVYFGGDEYLAGSRLRATNLIYYPNSFGTLTTIDTELGSLTCDP